MCGGRYGWWHDWSVGRHGRISCFCVGEKLVVESMYGCVFSAQNFRGNLWGNPCVQCMSPKGYTQGMAVKASGFTRD
jgi:hypothetical protein